MQAIVGDPETVAVIGPLNSSVAKAQIPISTPLACSSAARPIRTRASRSRSSAPSTSARRTPTEINYVRVVTTDDNQGPAMAKYIIKKLGLKTIYIIDSTDTFGKGIADNFQKDFEATAAPSSTRRRAEDHDRLQRAA